eukprot:COSAG02_NODE_51645_length_312_cov_401.507042_2_plen_33_part_01
MKEATLSHSADAFHHGAPSRCLGRSHTAHVTWL